jgi:hypothetical protein
MWVLRLGFDLHLKLPKSLMDYLKINLHASLTFRPWSSSEGTQLHIGYFKVTLHVGIAFMVGSSPKVYLNHLWIISK